MYADISCPACRAVSAVRAPGSTQCVHCGTAWALDEDAVVVWFKLPTVDDVAALLEEDRADCDPTIARLFDNYVWPQEWCNN